MHILCLTDYHFISGKWLWRYLPDHHDELDFVCSSISLPVFPHSKQLSYLVGAVKQASEAHRRICQSRYDIAVAWEIKNGFPFALYKRLSGRSSPPLIILSFSNRGMPAHIPGMMRFMMQSVEAITVPSESEAQTCARNLDIPSERIHVCHNAAFDIPHATLHQWVINPKTPSEAYIFSGGYSHRDFATLIQAIDGLEISLYIVAPRSSFMKSDVDLQSNIIWQTPLPNSTYNQLMAFSRIVVIPLENVAFSIGLMDLLTAMAFAKPIIITNTAVISEYVLDRQDGLLVSPGDPQELRHAIQYLLDHPKESRWLGLNARRKYEQFFMYETFAKRAYQIICKVAESNSQN